MRHQVEMLSERQHDLQNRKTELHLDELEEKYLCCVCLKEGEYRDVELLEVQELQREEQERIKRSLQYRTQALTGQLIDATRDVAQKGAGLMLDGVTDSVRAVATVTKSAATATMSAAEEVKNVGTLLKKAARLAHLTRGDDEEAPHVQVGEGRELPDGTVELYGDAELRDANAPLGEREREDDVAGRQSPFERRKDRHVRFGDTAVPPREADAHEAVVAQLPSYYLAESESDHKKHAFKRKALCAYHKDKGLVRVHATDIEMLSAFYRRPIRGFLCEECFVAAKYRLDTLHSEVSRILALGKRPLWVARPVEAPDATPDGRVSLPADIILCLRRQVRCGVCMHRQSAFFYPPSFAFMCQFCCCRDKAFRSAAVCINNEPVPRDTYHALLRYGRMLKERTQHTAAPAKADRTTAQAQAQPRTLFLPPADLFQGSCLQSSGAVVPVADFSQPPMGHPRHSKAAAVASRRDHMLSLFQNTRLQVARPPAPDLFDESWPEANPTDKAARTAPPARRLSAPRLSVAEGGEDVSRPDSLHGDAAADQGTEARDAEWDSATVPI